MHRLNMVLVSAQTGKTDITMNIKLLMAYELEINYFKIVWQDY
jgi:hypothetical protein